MYNYLNTLLNIIAIKYLFNSKCILHITETNYLAIHSLPQVIVNPENFNQLLERNYRCNDIIISSDNVFQVLEDFEDFIRKISLDNYSERKYILVDLDVNSDIANTSSVSLLPLKFIRDLLLIKITNESFELHTHNYTGKQTGAIGFVHLDTWMFKSEMFNCNAILFPDKVTNQNGRQLEAASVDYVPFVINESQMGCEMELILAYCAQFNLTPSFFQSLESSWGQMFNNWTGTGIVGRLLEDVQDVCFGALFAVPRRTKFSHFSTPTSLSRVKALVPKPKIIHSWFVHLFVLSKEVWLCFYIGYICMVFGKVAARMLNNQHSVGKLMEREAFSTYGMLLCQSQKDDRRVRILSYRVVVFIGLMTTVLFTSIYSSRLLTSMIHPSYSNKIMTVEDMVASNLPWAEDDIEWVTPFEDDTNPIYQKLHNRFEVKPDSELRQLLIKGKYGFPIEKLPSGLHGFGEYLHLDSLGQYEIMPEKLYTVYSAILMRKNSVLASSLNLFILRCWETGLLIIWEKRASMKYTDMNLQYALLFNKYEIPKQPLHFDHLKGAFLVLFIGLCIASITFVCEY